MVCCISLEKLNCAWSFISAIGTVGLAVVGFCGLRSLRLWRRQKQEEVKAEWASKLLKDINFCESKTQEWLRYIFPFVYSRRSQANLEKLALLVADKEKKAFLDLMQNDPYELTNYLNQTDEILRVLEALRVDGEYINENISTLAEGLIKFVNNIKHNLFLHHFINSSKDQKISSFNVLSKASDNFKSNFDKDIKSVKGELKKYIFYQR